VRDKSLHQGTIQRVRLKAMGAAGQTAQLETR
jgi:hypothetical protein